MRTQLFVTNVGDRPSVPNIAILVTDGRANRETDQTQEQVDYFYTVIHIIKCILYTFNL